MPDDPDLAPLFRIYAVLLLARGTAVTAADVHNAWAAWMSGHDPGHDQLRPYEDLDPEIAARDDVYVDAIRRIAVTLATTNAAR